MIAAAEPTTKKRNVATARPPAGGALGLGLLCVGVIVTPVWGLGLLWSAYEIVRWIVG